MWEKNPDEDEARKSNGFCSLPHSALMQSKVLSNNWRRGWLRVAALVFRRSGWLAHRVV